MFNLVISPGGSNKKNAFYCPHCKAIKEHIRVGFSEMRHVQAMGESRKLFARFSDAVGITSLHNTIFGASCWKCTGCANTHSRNSSGKLDEDFIEDGTAYFEYDNGIYHGGFRNFIRNGYGTYEFTNGEKYDGNWENGEKHGYGTYTWADGTRRDGIWKNGNVVEWL